MAKVVTVGLVLLLAILAGLYWQGLRSLQGDELDFVGQGRTLFDAVFADVTSEAPNPVDDLMAFAAACRRNSEPHHPDAEVARLGFQLAKRLMKVNRLREQVRAELRQYLTAPPSTIGRQPGEQKRRQEFYLQQTVRQKWLPVVEEHRPACLNLLGQMEETRQQTGGVTRLWKILQQWLAPVIEALGRVQTWLPGEKKTEPTTSRSAAFACGRCQGSGRITCPDCGGFGKVDTGQMEPCPRCGGTGRYKKQMTAGEVNCPYCRGTGLGPLAKRAPCSRCEGKGNIPCPDCQPAPKSGRRP